MTNGCKQMKTTLYHEIEPQTLDDVRRNGLKRKGDGEKSDSDTKTADAYLDTHRPPETIRAQLCRDGVLYGFLPAGDRIVDIRNGAEIDIATFDRDRPQTLLRIAVDPTHCFVSDLDLYDRVKRALKPPSPTMDAIDWHRSTGSGSSHCWTTNPAPSGGPRRWWSPTSNRPTSRWCRPTGDRTARFGATGGG